jgi:hypothetical protein
MIAASKDNSIPPTCPARRARRPDGSWKMNGSCDGGCGECGMRSGVANHVVRSKAHSADSALDTEEQAERQPDA